MRKNGIDLEQMTPRSVAGFVLVIGAAVALLAFTWKFGLEEFVDPMLPGDHSDEHPAERWEFVIAATLFALAAATVPSILVSRLIKKQLRASRLAAAVFNATPQALVVTDEDRCVEAVNPAFEELTGFSAQEIIGKAAAVLRSNLHDDAFYDGIGHEIATRHSWSGEVWNRRRDGSEYAIWLSITPVNDSQRQVTQYVGVLTDITWRKQHEAQVLHQASHDMLTGLANRRLLHERLTQMLGAASVGGEMIALLFIDLDDFKRVNDQHGHAAGDAVLIATAERLAQCARGGDVVARLGGDEFVLVLREVAAVDAVFAVAQRCLQRLAPPCPIDSPTAASVAVSASIGIALFPNHADHADALLHCADTAMYEVKRRGRNACGLYAGAEPAPCDATPT